LGRPFLPRLRRCRARFVRLRIRNDLGPMTPDAQPQSLRLRQQLCHEGQNTRPEPVPENPQ